MTQVEIRQVKMEDARLLQQVGRQTFMETFAASNSEANMAQYLGEAFALHKLEAELRGADSEFFFATSEGTVAGYLKLNSGGAQTELKDDQALEIERIYVLQEFQGKRVGQLLFETALQRATEKGASYVWLGVWEENEKAIRFYIKNGFTEFGRHRFRLGADEQTDIMMKRPVTVEVRVLEK